MEYKIEQCPLFVNIDDPKDPKRHSLPVVESLLLASVKGPTPVYNTLLNEEHLSSLYTVQEQAFRLASWRHQQWLTSKRGEQLVRAGFLLADGPGTGKSRVIASLIHENWLQGRKRSVWITVSRDLLSSCRETLKNVGCPSELMVLPSWNLNVQPKDGQGHIIRIPESHTGVLFMTYVSIVLEGREQRKENHPDVEDTEGEGVSSLGTTNRKKLDTSSSESVNFNLLLAWLGDKFDGLVVFDECHKMKNAFNVKKAKQSETGKLLCKLQDMLPNARILYSSATAAMEPVHFAYMPRLGVWGVGTPFISREDFIARSNKAKLTEVETLICSLKKRGACVSRQLGLDDVKVEITYADVAPALLKTYDDCSLWWKEVFQLYKAVMSCSNSSQITKRNRLGVFWSACLNFFRNYCLCSKIYPICEMTENILKDENKCVIIGLQTTGESALRFTKQHGNTSINLTASNCRYIMQRIITVHIQSILEEVNANKMNDMDNYDEELWDELRSSLEWMGDDSALDEVDMEIQKRNNFDHGQSALLQEFENRRLNLERKAIALYDNLPGNFIDMLRYIFKEKGIAVSEMTGRKLRMDISNDASSSSVSSRGERKDGKSINELERERFITGLARVLIISEAASTGLDLQATYAIPGNQRQRVHITAELNWSVDRLIQQVGRSNRGNQTSSPIYYMLYAKLPGELRFSSNIAKKLTLMGASVQGDRRSNNQRMFQKFDYDNELGQTALKYLQRCYDLQEPSPASVLIPQYNEKDYISYAERELTSVGLDVENLRNVPVSKFLNRLLLCCVDIGRLILGHFESIYDALYEVEVVKYETTIGVQEITFFQENSKALGKQELQAKDGHPTGCFIYDIEATSGVLLKELFTVPDESTDEHVGWYKQPADIKNPQFDRPNVCAVLSISNFLVEDLKTYMVLSPYFTKTVNEMELLELLLGYRKSSRTLVERHWVELEKYLNPYQNPNGHCCIHAYSHGVCKDKGICREGVRSCRLKIITGDLYCIWDELKTAFYGAFGDLKQLKLTRIKLDEIDDYVFGVVLTENDLEEQLLKNFNLI